MSNFKLGCPFLDAKDKAKGRSYGFIGGGLEIMGTPPAIWGLPPTYGDSPPHHEIIISENERVSFVLIVETTDSDGVPRYRWSHDLLLSD